MNVFNAIGRIAKDAEVRFTQSGKPVTSWSLAVDSGYGDHKKTTWVDCQLWGERGQKIAGHLHKGDRLGVSGEITLDEYIGRDGSKQKTLKLRVNEVTLCSDKREVAKKQTRPAPTQTDNFVDDAIPF